MTLLLGLLLASAGAPEAAAQEVRFGYSGLHALDAASFEAMSEVERRAFLDARSALATQLGAEVLRTGSASPRHLKVLEDELEWTVLDHRIGTLGASGVEVALTLPELPKASDASAFRTRLAELLERYDGDLDFGVEQIDLNTAFPDINGSGSITNDDWEASDADKLAWAQAHQVRLIEVGERVRAIEDSSTLPDDAYAEHLQALMTIVENSDGELSLMLGSVYVHEDSQQRFVDRLSALDDAQRASLDRASAIVHEEITSLDVSDARINLEKFEGWLFAAELQPSERWLGGLSVPSGVSSSTCAEGRCSERTQVSGLVRLVVSAVRSGYTHLLYERPVEVVGAGIAEDAWTTTGLFVLELVPDIDISLLPLRPRPANAVWRWLQEALSELQPDDFAGLHDAPQGVDGVSLPGGWLLWFDWSEVVAPDADYDGQERPVILSGIEAPSLRVVSLWPESVGAQLGSDGDVAASYSEMHVPVVDGSAQIMVGQDPLWVEPSTVVIEEESASEEEIAEEPDVEASADDVEAGPTTDVDDTAAPDDGSGCQGGEQPSGALLLLSLFMFALYRCRDGLTA